jgi:DNA-binding NarL/FixJ family response regulator
LTLRCVIVDDNRAVLRAASDLLEAQRIAVVGVAASSEEALRLMDELQPDVMLVDIDIGPESGFELARRLSRGRDGARSCVILTSTHDEADYASLIAASPAVGFLPKSDLSATAIRRLLASTRHGGPIERRGRR